MQEKKDKEALLEDHLNDGCASVSHAITEVLVKKLRKAIKHTGVNTVVLAGGVSANSTLREKTASMAEELNCGEGDGNDGVGNNFLGDIDATDLKNHPKVDCIYGKLNQTGAMKKVISKFAGENTQFNLNISVGDAGDAYGSLDSSLGDNTFRMIISDSELGRTPLEISGTFLHEAIHAEMKRYLYGATDTSSLSGFPGDFSSDWDNYVFEKYGDLENPVTVAEHEAMAKKYTRIIANGLQEFDNDQLKRSSYEALAYISLIDTETWKNLDQDKKDEIGANYQDLKDNVLDTRSKKCK